MTDLDLPALKKLCEAATPGPWEIDCGETVAFIPSEGEQCVLMEHGNGFATEDDYRFAAAARTALPKLIEEMEILREELERSRAAYDNACDNWKSCTQILTKRDQENTTLRVEVKRRGDVYEKAELRWLERAKTLEEKNAALRGLLVKTYKYVVEEYRQPSRQVGASVAEIENLLRRINAVLGENP